MGHFKTLLSAWALGEVKSEKDLIWQRIVKLKNFTNALTLDLIKESDISPKIGFVLEAILKNKNLFLLDLLFFLKYSICQIVMRIVGT